MAKRFGGKKSKGKAAKKGRKKSKKRVAAGRKLARYRALAKQIGKAAAREKIYGGGRGKKGKKIGKRKGKGHKSHSHRHGVGIHRDDFRLIVEQVQSKEGTLGWPATGDEIRKAHQIADAYNYTKGKAVSPEERILQEAASKVKQLKYAAAARVVAAEIEEERRRERKRIQEEAARKIENMAARL